MQKCWSELAQASSYCHDESVHVHTSLGRKNTNDCLRDLSVSSNAFLKDSLFASTSTLGNNYDIFGIKPLQNLQLGIYALLNGWIFKSFGSDKVMTKPYGVGRQRKPLIQIKLFILRGVNSLLTAIDRDAGVPALHVGFSNQGCSVHYNALFLNSGLRRVLEGDDYCAVDIVFPMIGPVSTAQPDFEMTRRWLVLTARIPIWRPK